MYRSLTDRAKLRTTTSGLISHLLTHNVVSDNTTSSSKKINYLSEAFKKSKKQCFVTKKEKN